MHIVVNPAAAAGRTLTEWHKIEKILQKRKVDYQVHFSTLQESIEDICRKLTERGAEIKIVIFGGDGTMNEAVNGLQNLEKVKLGWIPCGSGNDFALGLGVAKDHRVLIDRILQNQILRTIDIGEIIYHHRCDFLDARSGTIEHAETYQPLKRRFNISAGIGFDAAICEAVAVSKAKKILNQIHLGSTVYIVEAVRLIFSNQKTAVTIDYGNGIFQEYPECAFAVAMNTPFEGGGFQFCPKANPQDEKLDLCIVDGLSRNRFFRAFPSAYHGGHLSFKGVYEETSPRARIRAKEPMWVHNDGEVICKSKDIEIGIAKEKLNLLI